MSLSTDSFNYFATAAYILATATFFAAFFASGSSGLDFSDFGADAGSSLMMLTMLVGVVTTTGDVSTGIYTGVLTNASCFAAASRGGFAATTGVLAAAATRGGRDAATIGALSTTGDGD